MPVRRGLVHELALGKRMAESIIFSREEELVAYRTMLLIRRFEEKAGQLYALGAITGSCPLSIGQEGSITGLLMAAKADDPVITAQRSHGVMLARGIPPEAIMAELLGRQTGLSRGRGGSLHMLSPSHAFYGATSIAGSSAALALGIAFAARYRAINAVTLCFYGDGQANKGRVLESYKLAADLSLPVVFIIDNNTASSEPPAVADAQPLPLSEIGRTFGIPGEQVDGIDVRRARAAGYRAIAHARAGKGPAILEMLTYRYRGHGGLPARAGVSEKRRDDADPIMKARGRIVESGFAIENELKVLEKDIREKVASAASFAKASPAAEPATLYEGGPG